MLKRIDVRDLRVGMFLHEFCGSWMDHPFWRTKFKLTDPQDIQRVLASSIREVWIDTSKGLDVEGGQAKEESDAEISVILAQAEQFDEAIKRVTIEYEMDQARKIVSKAKEAVTSMFHEVRMGKALDAGDAMPLVEEISNSVMRNPGAVISIARLKNKDEYTYMHSVAVCGLMVVLARQLGLDSAATRQAGLAGLLHDVGKMAIPFDILDKPGKLTDEEFSIIKSHPSEGHKMLLEGSGVDEAALDVCLHHHEKMDGSGYPEGLTAEQISLFAKMGAVCDVYDAITSNRPYKSGWDPAESLRKMAEWSKGHFDSTVFQAFVKSIGIYPVGSLVRLESGRIGVIVDQTEKSLLTPKVKVFYSTKSKMRIPAEILDLSRTATHDKIIAHEDPAKWNFVDLNELWGGVELWS
jgi:putative nucleotidyltransferase with HDIG domain